MVGQIPRGLIILLLAWIVVAAPGLPVLAAETGADRGTNQPYSQEQLDRLLAPIALYPDILLSEILMASTYPLEVVEADRWRKQNSALRDNELDEALKDKPWDVSVKSLCHFPRELEMMSQNLENTIALGNAYLDHQDQVMDTIQKLRARARTAGYLNSSNEEKVVVQDQYVSIEPVQPDVVYIPAYNPCTIYGPWWYPECAPLWFWWPDTVVGLGFWWWPPIFIGHLQGWCGFNWHQHAIFIHPQRAAFLGGISLTRMHGGVETWQHNPIHRRGVVYPNAETARRFGQVPRAGVEARRPYRGFSPSEAAPGLQQHSAPRPMTAPPVQPGRPELRGPEGPPASREFHPPAGGPRPQPEVGPRPMPAPRVQTAVPQPRPVTPFEGFGHSGQEVRQHSERGFQSMGDGSHGGGHPGGSMPQGGGGHGGGHR
ncbi:MAG TPA: DUF3300 domain-containing protein [Thermodesulfobacteriota bacterium]|nr:DUF3300 domain-containing protein [Thermodesulfobacteriota bacterium]